MFIQPWDAAVNEDEWREWLATTEHFGILAVNNVDPTSAPVMVPTHFSIRGNVILAHLARPNPAWPHLEAAHEVRLAVVSDYAFIPGYWRAPASGPEENGVPTSYYAAVQFSCRVTIVDDPAAKAEILAAQLQDFQSEGRHAGLEIDGEPYGRLLPGIRGLRLDVVRVDAKFKYDDAKPIQHRERVIEELEHRNRGFDSGAARQQRRRLGAIGEWRDSRRTR